MYALTLKQPWAFAVAELGKDIENRTWRPPPSLIGQRFAIHAGKGFDHDGMAPMYSIAKELGLGDKIPGWTDSKYPRGQLVAVATLADVVTESKSLWFGGPFGFVLTDVRKLSEPCTAKGYQKFWSLSPVLEEIVRSRAA